MNEKHFRRMIAESRKLLKEIENIKKLFILHLVKSGATSSEIRSILKVSGKDFRKLLPQKRIKHYKYVGK
jgi:arsenate reductase-like glutaredoxin family protein